MQNFSTKHACITLNSLASQTLSRGGERVWSIAYIDLCLTPQGFVWSLIGSVDVCGRDIELLSYRLTRGKKFSVKIKVM